MAKCPVCGGKLIENDKTIQCEHCFPEKACDFTLWKESTKKFFGVNLTWNLFKKFSAEKKFKLQENQTLGRTIQEHTL